LLPARDIAALKRRFLRKKTEPNVLAFPEPLFFPHPETWKRYLGEIYLNRDIMREEPGRGRALLLHGILHLLGHDHKRRSDARAMELVEKNILKKLP
jgi:probable rRNA maturation factor